MSPAVRVVVISRPADDHGDAVCDELERRGAPVWRASLNTFLSTNIYWEPRASLLVQEEEGALEVPAGASAYFRRPGWAVPSVEDPHEAAALSEETHAQFFGLLEALTLRWLDSPSAVRRAELKLHQLQVAHGMGVAVPAAALTNLPGRARAFLATGPAVAKATGPGTIESPEGSRPMFTSEFTAREDLLGALRTCPVLLQRRVDIRRDVRIVTVKSAAFAAARERTDGEPPDWRETDPKGQGFRPYGEASLMQQAVALAGQLGLAFSAQDWALTDEGPVFLEANPAGQWLFLPEKVATAVTSGIAEALLSP